MANLNSTVITPRISNEGRYLRLVLITNGLRPLSYRFAALQGQPIGVVSWYGAESGGLVKYIERFKVLARLYARLRKRQHTSLSHLCCENNLLYASIQKSGHDTLHDVLAIWQPDLVNNFRVPLDTHAGASHYTSWRC